MEGWHSLFSGNAESARDLASKLEDEGIRSFVDDRQGPIVTRSGSRSSHSVVLVPLDEIPHAEDIAKQWELQNRGDAAALSRRLARIFGFSLIPPLTWALAYLFVPQLVPTPSLGWILGIWALSFIGIAQIEHRRHLHEHIKMPAA
jgi:hypothetical protein